MRHRDLGYFVFPIASTGQFILSLTFYVVRLSLIIVLTVVLATATILAGLIDPNGKIVYRINQFWTWAILFAGGVKLNVTGVEKLDRRRPYIFMVNHQSNIDIPILVQSLSHFQLRWIAKKELLRVPLFGWALWAGKHITVDREKPIKAVRSLRRAKERIAAGISVVVFPEGTRSRDGQLQRFKKGGFLLAFETQTDVVPVTIVGSRYLLPSGAWRLRSGQVDVIVDQPFSIAGYRPGNLRLLMNQIRETISTRLREAETGRFAEATALPLRHQRAWENQRI